MTVFDDLAATMDLLVGAGVGRWVLGALLVMLLMMPLVFLSRVKPVSEKAFLFLAAVSLVINVGVGWWDSWVLLFIFVFLIVGGVLFRQASGGGGVA